MIRQQVKDVYHILTRFLTLPNYYIAKLRLAFRSNPKGHYLHLACGPVYIPGMINTDVNIFRKTDLWLDLRNGLPCADSSVYFVYFCNAIHHLYPDDAIRLLKEIRRVLRPDGIARVSAPSFEYVLQEIVTGKVQSKWPRAFEEPLAQAINQIFCDGQCKYAYSFGVFDTFARQAGFREVINYSQKYGNQLKRYGDIEVGNEPKTQLVVELLR